MELMNLRTARTSLNRLVEGWRGTPGRPVFIGPYGSMEAVIAPLAVWHRLVALAAAAWDTDTAAARAARLDDPTGPQPTDFAELARVAGCAEPPVPVLQSRGVPRGGAQLRAWPAALDDVRTLAGAVHQGTPIAALQALGSALLGRAPLTDSRCGHGTSYTVADVDGLHVAVLTIRRVSRPAGRRGSGGYDTVELVGVDHISW